MSPLMMSWSLPCHTLRPASPPANHNDSTTFWTNRPVSMSTSSRVCDRSTSSIPVLLAAVVAPLRPPSEVSQSWEFARSRLNPDSNRVVVNSLFIFLACTWLCCGPRSTEVKVRVLLFSLSFKVLLNSRIGGESCIWKSDAAHIFSRELNSWLMQTFMLKAHEVS